MRIGIAHVSTFYPQLFESLLTIRISLLQNEFFDAMRLGQKIAQKKGSKHEL
jgi:hypothetical protein